MHSADSVLTHASVAERRGPTLSATTVTSIAGAGLVAAVGGDALLIDGFVGIAFPLAAALFAAIVAALAWRTRGQISREAAAWLGVAVFFASGHAWRDSDVLQALDVAVTLIAFTMTGVALGNSRCGLLAEAILDTLLGFVTVIRGLIAGFLPLLFHEVVIRRGEQTRHAGQRALRNVLITVSLLVVFGGLLRGADPIFASVVALPAVDWGSVFNHVFVIGVITWVVCGWSRTAIGGMRAPRRAGIGFGLDASDVTVALGTLNVLFAAFVLVQLGWFFGGEEFLRARTGLTAAAYARGGFFQMALVALLVIPVLLVTRAALLPGRALARRHTLLGLPIIALLGVMIASSMLRMRLYIHYYGMTTDRLYPMVFMGWLCVALLWLALTVLRDWPRPWLAGVVFSGLVTLAALHVVSPDGLVARINVARSGRPAGTAAGTSTLDVAHLAKLSGDAADEAVDATLHMRAAALGATPLDAESARCAAAHTLLRRWGPTSTIAIRRNEKLGAWRFWNAGEVHALGVVGAHSAELRTVMHASCAVVSRNAAGSGRVPSPTPSRGSAGVPTSRGN